MLPITGVAGSDLRGRFAQDGFSMGNTAVRRQKRKISREAGQAIEMLGHAIEYLSDELALECMVGQSENSVGARPRVAAIEILKMLNRDVYLSCPAVPSLEERLQGWMRRWNGPQQAMRPALVPVTRRTRW